jgi:hypothetical protein
VTEVGSDIDIRQHLRSLSYYTLSPINTAIEAVEQEKKIIESEIAAFDKFARRVSDLDCDTAPNVEYSPFVNTKTHSQLKQVQSKYQETVMATKHYRTEYGESFAENLKKEFGPEISSQLTQSRSDPFTPTFKQTILGATQQSITTRSTLQTRLNRECDSLYSSLEEIEEILDPMEQVLVPEWYRAEFIERMDKIAANRQELIQSNSHHFYKYLYNSDPTLYPVLLALGRLREAVIV